MSAATKRPATEMRRIADCLVDRLRPACDRIEIAGSLRRGVANVGDIEVVAIPRVSKRVQTSDRPGDLFTPAGKVETTVEVNDCWARCDELADTGSFTKRGERYRQFVFAGAKVDVFTAVPDSWGWILLIRTGSADFSHWMAGELNRRGYCSSEGRIHRSDGRRKPEPVGQPIPTPDELEVFRLAGHVFIDPPMREIAPGVRRTT